GGRQEGSHVEIGDLGGDADGVSGGVEGANGADAAAPVKAGGPEGLPADAVGCYHTQARHHDSAHGCSRPFRGRPLAAQRKQSGHRPGGTSPRTTGPYTRGTALRTAVQLPAPDPNTDRGRRL